MRNRELAKKILFENSQDEKQLEVIKANAMRVIVEAPAGFGKTYTMVNMISYWLAEGLVKNNQKVLCLSFSVSAANRMKESIDEKFKGNIDAKEYLKMVWATNFHGFCRSVLDKYGYLIDVNEVESLSNVSSTSSDVTKCLSVDDQNIINEFESGISSATISVSGVLGLMLEYNRVVKGSFLPVGELPYTAIITLTLELFETFPHLLKFYHQYFSAICVDEFQDTNVLGLALIEKIVGNMNRFVAFGDTMQEIYRFLGAIPNLIDIKAEEKTTRYIKLNTNYRFKNNENMRCLDKNMRLYRDNPNRTILEKTDLLGIHGKTVTDEAAKIAGMVNYLREKYKRAKIGILVSQNNSRTEELMNSLSNQIQFFNATFKEDDQLYVDIQLKAAQLYENLYKDQPIISKNVTGFVNQVREITGNSKYKESILKLLETFLKKSINKFEFEYRSEHILLTLMSQSLRQSLIDVEAAVTVSTIHGAKGLEWDYVIIANFEQGEFPNYFECRNIGFDNSNVLVVGEKNIEDVRELINKFYVAFTRAKKGVFVSYSDVHGEISVASQISCLANLSFINVKDVKYLND